MPTPLKEQIQQAVTTIEEKTAQRPTIGLVLGSGLSSLADAVESPEIIPFDAVPNWPASTVPGHSGRLLFGTLEGKNVLVQQGRVHFYEGYTMDQVTFPIRVMHALGIKTVVVTNAAGGINRDFTPGDLMLIKDHINFPGLAGNNPLRGANDDEVGVRFPDMTFPYDPELRKLAHETAVRANFRLQEGVYAFVGGPSFETPAELRYLNTIGVDAVGMSTAPSVTVARHAGMRVLGISSITNKANLNPIPSATTTHEEVLETGKLIVPRLIALLRGVLKELAD